MKPEKNKILKRIMSKLGKAGIWTVILTLIIFISQFIASLIQSDFGNVSIETVYFAARDEQTVQYRSI